MEDTVELKDGELLGLVDTREALRYLGYGEQDPTPEIMEELCVCRDLLLTSMRPCYRYVLGELSTDTQGDTGRRELSVHFSKESLRLPGRSIREHLADCNAVLCACLTLGEEVDRQIALLQEESMLSALLFDALANAAVERLRATLEERAAARFSEWGLNWLFGIGYGDLPLTIQGDFLRLMDAPSRLGLSCNEKFVLFPTKSVTGLIGIRQKDGKYGAGQKERAECFGNGSCEKCGRQKECPFSGKK